MIVTVLTGAGLSAAAGIPALRGPSVAGDTWSPTVLAEHVTPQRFLENPGDVHRIYNDMRRRLEDPATRPTRAHWALSEFGRQLGPGNLRIITQNIDNLHERAGSTDVLHLHGRLDQIREVSTGKVEQVSGDIPETTKRWRPNVVWESESVFDIKRAVEMIYGSNVFVAIGTSSTVPPASHLVLAAKEAGIYTIEINPEETPMSEMYDRCHREVADIAVPLMIEGLLAVARR